MYLPKPIQESYISFGFFEFHLDGRYLFGPSNYHKLIIFNNIFLNFKNVDRV